MKRSQPRGRALFAQLFLLWKLRWTLARGSIPKGGGLVAPLAGLLALGVSTIAAFTGARALLASPGVAHDERLTLFFLLLIGFLASTMWIAWPVVTAGVDDAAELSRFSLFPVSSGRLFFASITAALVEPRTLPFWGALLGAGSAVADRTGIPYALVIVATVALASLSIVWGRVGLHLVLNLLRHRRSAEAMGAGLVAMLGLCALVPPPDLSWIKDVSHGVQAVSGALVQGGIAVFSLLPTGAWAWLLEAARRGRPLIALFAAGYLLVALVGGYVAALWLLERFHRRAGRALPQSRSVDARQRPFGSGSLFRVLCERELHDLVMNPRVRLMVALPFFLAILLKLVGARALAQVFFGAQADAWIAGALGSYAALVLGAGLSQNLFGYDGPGAAIWLSAPVEPRRVLVAKNVVIGGVSALVVVLVLAFDALYIGRPAGWVLPLVLANAAYQILLALAAGNVLSIIAPRRFHSSLRRRDRAPPIAVAVGFGVASLAVLPGSFVLRMFAPDAPPWSVVAGAWLMPVLAFIAWRASLALALKLLSTRRPELVRALARA